MRHIKATWICLYCCSPSTTKNTESKTIVSKSFIGSTLQPKNLSSSFLIELSVNTAWPETLLPLRLPLTRPLYSAGTGTDTGLPDWLKATIIPLLTKLLAPSRLSPQRTPRTPLESLMKLQVKFKEEPTNPVTDFPL